MTTNKGNGQLARRRRFGRLSAVIGLAGLSMVGAAYALTYEPAPRIRVQWQTDLDAVQRARLEHTYLLANSRDPIPDGSIAYDLLDTSVGNIRALVNDPAVTNTGDIDENVFVVPFETEYGESWMWIAHRIPVLREARLRAWLIAVLLAMTIGGSLAMRRR